MREHIDSVKTYAFVFVALLALTALTTLVAEVDMVGAVEGAQAAQAAQAGQAAKAGPVVRAAPAVAEAAEELTTPGLMATPTTPSREQLFPRFRHRRLRISKCSICWLTEPGVFLFSIQTTCSPDSKKSRTNKMSTTSWDMCRLIHRRAVVTR